MKTNNESWILLLFIILFLFGCKEDPDNSNKTSPINSKALNSSEFRNYKLGIVPIPQDFTAEKIQASFQLSKQVGEVVSISRKLGWDNDIKVDEYQNEARLAKNNNLELFISIDLMKNDRKSIHFAFANIADNFNGKGFSDTSVTDAFQSEVIEIVNRYSPKYLMLALEINVYQREAPSDFLQFVNLYNNTYDAVKAINSSLQIGVTFQYEDLLNNANWEAISAFGNKLDIIGFSTYPLIARITDLNSLGNDYYSPLSNLKNGRIIFTEVGWKGYDDASEIQQANFIDKFFSITQNLDRDLVIWSLLHDWSGPEAGEFETMGLIDANGNKKAAWDRWKKYADRVYR